MTLTTDPFLDGVTALLFVATVALALYTAKLRKATVVLAADTVAGTSVADRHHQESLSPICVIKSPRCDLTGVHTQPSSMQMAMHFGVENVGNGPAFQLTVKTTPVNAALQPTAATLSKVVGPLKAGASTPELGPVTEFHSNAEGFVVRLEYLSIFGTEGFSEWYVSNISECKPLSQELPKPKERF